jgi:two-component system response regulator RegA
VAAAKQVRSVLLVDDDERVLAALIRTLGPSRSVFTASDTRTAARVCRRELPDLAVVDLRLGSASGLDAVRALKAESPQTVVVLISGYLTTDVTVAAVKAGADVVMAKPVTGTDIVRRLEQAEPANDDETPTLARAEAEHIARVLADCDGNVSEAARRLGICRSTLQRKLRKESSS